MELLDELQVERVRRLDGIEDVDPAGGETGIDHEPQEWIALLVAVVVTSWTEASRQRSRDDDRPGVDGILVEGAVDGDDLDPCLDDLRHSCLAAGEDLVIDLGVAEARAPADHRGQVRLHDSVEERRLGPGE